MVRHDFEFSVKVCDAAPGTRFEPLVDAARDASPLVVPAAVHARPLAVKLRDGVARLFTHVL